MKYTYYDLGFQMAKMAAYRGDRAIEAQKRVWKKMDDAKARGDMSAYNKYKRVDRNLENAFWKDVEDFGKEVSEAQSQAARDIEEAKKARSEVRKILDRNKPQTPKPQAPKPQTPKPQAPKPQAPKPSAPKGDSTSALGRLKEYAKKIPGKKALPYAAGAAALGAGGIGAYKLLKNRNKNDD